MSRPYPAATLRIQQKAAIQSNTFLSKTGYFFFSWENRFHEATKWHCCILREDLRERDRIAPIELQARLLLALLEQSSQTKHIQLSTMWITRPLQCQISFHRLAHLLSPHSFFCSFCLIFKGGSWIVSILTLLVRTGELWGFYDLWAEDWSQCQNFLALIVTLPGTSAAEDQWACNFFYLLEKF